MKLGGIAAIVSAVTIFVGLVTSANAQSDDTPSPSPWLVWHTDNFFTTCGGNCGFAIYGGREVTTDMTKAFLLEEPVAPWHDHVGNSDVVAASLLRRFLTIAQWLDLEVEIGIDQRMGDMHATDGWAAMDFRWTWFPWNDYLRTTIALAEGGSYASQIDREERLRADNMKGSNYLNFFSPEVTFALPSLPNDELLLRFQHRSGAFGLINGVYGGSSFWTAGYRHRF